MPNASPQRDSLISMQKLDSSQVDLRAFLLKRSMTIGELRLYDTTHSRGRVCEQLRRGINRFSVALAIPA